MDGNAPEKVQGHVGPWAGGVAITRMTVITILGFWQVVGKPGKQKWTGICTVLTGMTATSALGS